ncbi:hypothetical protein DL98DRAFT_654917 [Cadophora sp. DSE1049]|nr:hypothetical protein DL98DRAFT_654917 [Cadophora sp. DSE1049]
MRLYYRSAILWDILPTVDISIALHKELSPLITTGWMTQHSLSASLGQSRRENVRSPGSRQSLTIIFERQNRRQEIADQLPDRLPDRITERLHEEVAAYLIGKRPHREGDGPIGIRYWVNQENSAAFFKHCKEWTAERREYLTEDTWELKEIAVSPPYQRQGLGSVLVKEWLRTVDAANGSAFVSATAKSKSFFEQFGFKSKKISNFDLGMALEPFIVHQMTRPSKSRTRWSGLSGLKL